MINFTGRLEDFLDTVSGLKAHKERVVLCQCNESNFYGLDRDTIRSILAGSRLTSDRCRVIANGNNLENIAFKKGKCKSGVVQSYLQLDKLNEIFEGSATLAAVPDQYLKAIGYVDFRNDSRVGFRKLFL